MPHHMIDIREPTELFTAGDYQREARCVLDELRMRGRVPILVGGTGLYLRALDRRVVQRAGAFHVLEKPAGDDSRA